MSDKSTGLEKDAFNKGQELVLNHVKNLFSENEEASIMYDDWLNAKD